MPYSFGNKLLTKLTVVRLKVRSFNDIVKRGEKIYKKYGAAMSPVCQNVNESISALKYTSLQWDCKARQALYVQCNVEDSSYKHFCSGKGINITYSGCG